MELIQISKEESSRLLKDKNILNEVVLDKYRLAGQITQTCLDYLLNLIRDSYHLAKMNPLSSTELCILGDSYLSKALKNVYSKSSLSVSEKGISMPVTIQVNDILSGVSPEIDDAKSLNLYFTPGDIVKISFGVHIDGYTSNVSHTIVIYPPPNPTQQPLDKNDIKPAGPLLGPKADAICASYIAIEAVVSLMGLAVAPEKIPKSFNSNNINGTLIRQLVDRIASIYNCVVVPSSKVRRVRRFLAGQAEGVVLEKEFKGIVWTEANQEAGLLARSESTELEKYNLNEKDKEFLVTPGEVYLIDIHMAPLSEFKKEVGLVTLEEVNNHAGSKDNSLKLRPSIFLRDFAYSYALRLSASRKTITKIDQTCSVYPFKISYLSDNFPIDPKGNLPEQIKKIQDDIKLLRLGMSEIVNHRLVTERPVTAGKFIPLEEILKASNPNGQTSSTVLPNALLDIPLPKLGITSLKLQNLVRYGKKIPIASESTTIILIKNGNNFTSGGKGEVLRLSGGSKVAKPNWVHSDYSLKGEGAEEIVNIIRLGQDSRFGVKIKECQPIKMQF
ncbi:putative hydrolase ASCRUDRAFT_38414 [Ascoidea rubescens DSM 1968]|uniref:Probable metalloprotease ARX1 n=1 Tax=Ascoidea rubescens DSM 1968 TaxID=1344418 RepID=A0A1D2VC05_9ASCO|nr:hypothetical protein ASCRUDRAFT_38414 [Ascoidea rubescens DSM 1968]ODV59092.1 hypothetical protein ASCRUDRAFT_38414 [Ascoidea rubescens DSM 1968]